MEDEALLAAFMKATGCGREDAFDRLASCGGHLGNAINTFFSIDAGPSASGRSRRRRSPPPTSPAPQVISVSSSSSEEEAARARPVVPPRRTRVSRWDSETRVVGSRSGRHRQRQYRRRPRDGSPESDSDREADGNHNRSRRRRRFREDIFSDGEDDVESNTSRRRRLNPTAELTSDSEGEKKPDDDSNSRRRFSEKVDVSSSSSSSSDYDDNMLLELAEMARLARQPPPSPPPPRNRTFEELFKVPRELTFHGGFHAAKAHAAWRARWLLANVQSFELPLPSLHQNRDVWGNALVARCVRDRFVLWQADAAAVDDDGQGEEAKKVLAYYKVTHDKLPVVVVVDPVTGQAMDVLHGSAACELNDFMLRLGPYTETKPAIPGKSTISASAGAQSNTRPATTITAPTSSERAAASRQQQEPTTVMRKQPDAVVAAVAVAVAPTCQTRQEQAPTTAAKEPVVTPCTPGHEQQPESVEEKVCKVRVRLADGRVVTKEFGSQCAVAALFEYCRSVLQGAGGAPEAAFRLLRFVGRAAEEIGDQNASFESLGLHLTTVSVHLG